MHHGSELVDAEGPAEATHALLEAEKARAEKAEATIARLEMELAAVTRSRDAHASDADEMRAELRAALGVGR